MDIVYTIWLRSIKRYLRSKSRIIGSLGMPLFFLLVMGFGLNSVVEIPEGGSYIGFIMPGIIAMSILFTSVFSGIQIIWDKQFGFLKETLVAPVSRTEIMLGQTVGGATTSFIQGGFMLALAFLLGLGVEGIAGISGIGIAVLFMVLIGLAFTAFGIAIASKMDDMHGFQMIINFVIFPIFGLSGAMFPLSGLPEWIRPVMYLDPLAYGVEGIRYGLTGASHIDPVICFIVLGGFTFAMIVVGAHFFRKIKI